MIQRILIRHISGARSNQIDEFPATAFREIVAGREDSSAIHFDPEREDLVSRQHLRITADPSAPGAYLIADLQSRNGTFVNRQRMTHPIRLQHFDVVQLGPGGPEFRFELDPPPASVARPTRIAGPAEVSAIARPTREASTAAFASSASPRPIGRATVERMLDDTFGKVRKESNKTLWVGVAAIVLIACVATGSWLYLRGSDAESAKRAQEQQMLLLQMAQVVRQQPSNDAAVKAQVEQISGQLKKVLAENQALRQNAAAADAAQARAAQATADPSSDYSAGLDQAMQLYKSGDYSGAYGAAAKVIGLDRSQWQGYYIAGSSLWELNQTSDAQTMFQYAMDEAPASVKPDLAQRIAAFEGSGGPAAN